MFRFIFEFQLNNLITIIKTNTMLHTYFFQPILDNWKIYRTTAISILLLFGIWKWDAVSQSTVTVNITADNAYVFGFGDANGITQLETALENCTAGEIYNCVGGAETYTVNNVNLNSYIYIIAWSDEATYQGVLAQFTDGTDTIFTSSTTPWEVFATGIDFDPVCSGGINSPSLNNINAQIALANSRNGGANSSVTWVNLSGAGNGVGRIAFDPSGNVANTPFPPAAVCGIKSSAQWMWYNPDPANITKPFITSASYPYFPSSLSREYYIFRIGNIGELLGDDNDCTLDTLNLTSGFDHNINNVFPIGAVDNHWSVTAQPTGSSGTVPRPANVVQKHPGWHGPYAESQWLSAHNTFSNSMNGVYSFEYKFCLADTAGAKLHLKLLVDDDAKVYLNNNLIGQTSPNPFSPGPFNFFLPGATITTSGTSAFNIGENTLRIDVNNRWGVAMGMDVKGYVTANAGNLTQMNCCDSTGSLCGTVWKDNNADGIRQPIEPAMGNVEILLNGILSGATDEFGNYFIRGIAAGTYEIMIRKPIGYVQTSPEGVSQMVTLQRSETKCGNDFGLQDVSGCAKDSLALNSGFNHHTDAPFAVGALDNFWMVTAQPTGFSGALPRPSVVIPKHPSWGIMSGSQWIAAHNGTSNYVNGVYSFEYTFCMNSTEDAQLSMQLLVDDDAKVYLNNNLIGQTPPNPFSPGPFNFQLPAKNISTTNASFFNVGENVIRVDVTNRWGVAMGFDATGSVKGAIGSFTRLTCCDSTGGITGRTFEDRNNDGTQDIDEPPVSGRMIQAVGNGFTYTARSDTFGHYYITGLLPGEYNVRKNVTEKNSSSNELLDEDRIVIVGGRQFVSSVDIGVPPATSTCDDDTLTFGTGFNHVGNAVYPVGALDNYWMVTAEPAAFGGTLPRPAVVVQKHPAWDGPLSNTQWLNVHSGTTNSTNGDYTFEYKFCLGETNNAALSMKMLVDDDAKVYLNNNLIGQTPPNPFSPGPWNFDLPAASMTTTNASFFVAGENVLKVVVTNRWGVAVGLNVSGFITANGVSISKRECCDNSGAISGYRWNDFNGDGVFQSAEVKTEGYTVYLSDGRTATTDRYGYYYFTQVYPGTYSVSESLTTEWIQTAPPSGSYIVAMGTNQAISGINFGSAISSVPPDTNKFRTFRADTALAAKPVKLKRAKDGTYPMPNTATVRDSIFKKGVSLVVGVSQSKDSAKFYGWLQWSKGADFGKFYTTAHSATSYPLDSIRITGKKSKPFVKVLKGDRKTYNNPLAAELAGLKFNLLGSEQGVLPKGLSNLEVNLPSSIFHEMTLGEITLRLDTAMTYWKRDYLVRDTLVASEIKNFLKTINETFYDALNDTNDYVYPPTKLKLKGIIDLNDIAYLKRSAKTHSTTVRTNAFDNVPETYSLLQNYPNPFNPSTVISYSLLSRSMVTLKVYNVLGQEVATLANTQMMEEGLHEMQFDGSALTSGVYFYRLNINNGEFTAVKKFVMMK
jgi:hypothetical protein